MLRWKREQAKCIALGKQSPACQSFTCDQVLSVSYRRSPHRSKGRDTLHDNELKLKYLCYLLERAVSQLPDGVHQICWLIDFKGFKIPIADLNHMKMSRTTMSVLQDHYPEVTPQPLCLLLTLATASWSCYCTERTACFQHFLAACVAFHSRENTQEIDPSQQIKTGSCSSDGVCT